MLVQHAMTVPPFVKMPVNAKSLELFTEQERSGFVKNSNVPLLALPESSAEKTAALMRTTGAEGKSAKENDKSKQTFRARYATIEPRSFIRLATTIG